VHQSVLQAAVSAKHMTQATPGVQSVDGEVRDAYIDLLMKTLTMMLWDARDGIAGTPLEFGRLSSRLRQSVRELIRGNDAEPDPKARRMIGRDWPRLAHTMIGMKRMENLRSCVVSVVTEGIAGDLIETGVWRGGATIFMRGILKAYGVRNRKVWVADSFEGLPKPNPEKYPADAGDQHHTYNPVSAISLEEVKSNFEKYGLLDEQVCFLKGWFKDTLPKASIGELAVVRLDGDLYESTTDALTTLYPKLNAGGYLIVDDFHVVPGCRKAVEDYRAAHKIEEPIQEIDGVGTYWRRARIQRSVP
jgi:O-methyltransferase